MIAGRPITMAGWVITMREIRTQLKSRDGRVAGELGTHVLHDRVTSNAKTLSVDGGREGPVAARYPNGSSFSELGVHTTGRWSPEPVITLFGGLRGSVFLIDIAARGLDGNNGSPALFTHLQGVGAVVGSRWAVTRGVEVHGTAGRGIRAPNVQDLSALGPRAKGRHQLPNPELEPEHSWTADLGVTIDTRSARLSAIAFYGVHENAIVVAPTTANGATHSDAGDRFFRSINAASVEIFGAESAFELQLLSGVSTFGRFLAMVGTQRNDEATGLPATTPADRIPPGQGEIGLQYEDGRRFRLRAFVVARLPQSRLNDPINVSDNRIPDGGTPGYATLHAHAQWALSHNVTLRAGLDNITNELVLEHGSGFYRPGFGGSLAVTVVAP